MQTIVTAGEEGADIDVFACAIAYSELLNLKNIPAKAIVPGAFTSSVTPSLLDLNPTYEVAYTPDGSEQFVLVDISDPKHFAHFVDQNKISEVYDHRHGHQDYWRGKLNENCHIEMVGSCGTLIWEEYKKSKQTNKISLITAKLLLASVVSNNLAMKSELTTERDLAAYNELKKITNLDDKWVSTYYGEQEEILFSNFSEYLIADTKKIDTKYGELVIGQIEVWDGGSVLDKFGNDLDEIMRRYEPTPWLVNIINVGSGYNYLFSNNSTTQNIITNSFAIKFTGGVAKTDKLLMRKYLAKVLQS